MHHGPSDFGTQKYLIVWSQNLFYYSSNGGIRLYIDGCQTTSTGARLGRETMRVGARCGPGLADDSELISNKLSSITGNASWS